MNPRTVPLALATSFLVLTSLFVTVIGISFAAPLGESESGSISSDFGTTINTPTTTTLKANGASCSLASECNGGFCNSGVCASSAPSTGTTSAPSGGTIISGGAAVTTPTITPTPAAEAPKAEEKVEAPPTEVAVTVTNIPVTETQTVQELVNIVSPEDLGVTTVSTEKVETTQVGVATTSTKATEQIVDTVLKTATDEAKQVLTEIKQNIASGSSEGVIIDTKLEVFQVKSTETNKVAYVSKVSLTFKAGKDLKEVKVVQIIPKSVAASIADVIFQGEKPKILQADPIVEWNFDTVKKDETKDLSYIVKKKLDKLNTTTVAVSKAEAAPTVPEKKAEAAKVSTEVYIAVGIIVLVAIVAIALKKKGKLSLPQRKFRYRYNR